MQSYKAVQRVWFAEGYPSYQERVHPQLQELLKTLGRNSIYAELAVEEVVREMTKRKEHMGFYLHACALASDLRITLRTEQGRFPALAVQNHVRFFGDSKHYKTMVWTSLHDRILVNRMIWRILSPVVYAVFDVDGKKVTLLFRLPFISHRLDDVETLAKKIYLEKDEVILTRKGDSSS